MKPKTTRRRFLAVGGAAALFGLAGCTGDAEDAEKKETTTDATSAANTTDATATTGERTVESEPRGTANATETETEALTPHGTGSVHYHGYLTFDVNGERVDYDETRFYQKVIGNPNFHFHETENENLTHVHAKDVTVHYALNALPGISVGRKSTVKIAGRTYTTADADTTMTITVDNKPVDPRTYVLKEHDHIEVLIQTSASKAPANGTNATNATTTGSGLNTTTAADASTSDQ